jgi:hypothetical protein
MQRRGLFRGSINTTPNTFIGGVASTIPDSATLATKLGIPESKIKSFEVVGNDIKAAINTTYSMPYRCWYNDVNITCFDDSKGKCTTWNNQTFSYIFRNATNLKGINFPGLLKQDGRYDVRGTNFRSLYFPELEQVLEGFIYEDGSAPIRRIYIPKATIGTDPTTFEGVFYFLKAGSVIYCDPVNETSNNGGVDADLQNAINDGATVVYIQNSTKPANITDLSYTTNGTDVTLTFTPPSSTNALDFYEVYVNGCYKQEISGSGAVISGLNNGDKVTVYACDEYYNRSISNEVTISGI